MSTLREFYNTLTPYKVLDYKGIQYGVCRDFDHISRYQGLRQVAHQPNELEDRFITLELPNMFKTRIEVTWYEVPSYLENRLDVIAYNTLGSATYAWIIAYINNIPDNFTVREGMKLRIPKSIYSLFNSGELLAPVSPLALNLGTE